MGRGIAMCFLDAGLPVTLVDVDDTAAAAAAAGIDATYRRSSAFKKGRLTEAALATKLAKLAVASDVAALGGADLVVEAIYEDLDAKRDVFAQLDGACKPTAVLASNTSTLAIDSIADAVADPSRVVGTCVEINQCVGCTRPGSVEQYGTSTITPSSRRRVERTRRKI